MVFANKISNIKETHDLIRGIQSNIMNLRCCLMHINTFIAVILLTIFFNILPLKRFIEVIETHSRKEKLIIDVPSVRKRFLFKPIITFCSHKLK